MRSQIAGACALLTVIAGVALPTTAAAAVDDVAAPTFSQPGGRYTAPTTIELSAPAGAVIHYTLDGSMPTAASPVYAEPLVIDESANLAAVSILDGDVSPAEVEGYLIKTEEEPLLSFVVMSDVHTSVLDDLSRAKWKSHFDTLASINPDPDLIISNGDQINDNNWNTAPDHQVVKTLFDENMARLGIEDTPVLMSHGNHDVGNADMAQYYGTWFPNASGGYYEKKTDDGTTFFVIDTESYSGTQRTWLQGRLAALAAEPGALNRPVFVIGHRPAANTVHDGAQASNASLTADLSLYPQVVYFSGHSHLHLNDERSIWQGGFTAVNDGSMSYTETPHDAYQIDGEGLFDEFTIASAQGLSVEVYADRTEIDRINFAAEDERTIVDGQWGAYQQNPPFQSRGTLAGPTWTVRLDGSTAEEIRSNYDYTSAARDDVAPILAATPEHVLTEDGGDALRFGAAADNESVYGYDVRVRDAATGAEALPIRAGAKVLADFQMAPRPSVLEIPLAVRDKSQAGSPLITLTEGTGYVADVTAVDMYGNRSETKSVEFVSGEDATAAAALKLGLSTPEVLPGEAATLTTTFTNQTDAPMAAASLALTAPEGWHVLAAGDARFDEIAAGQTQTVEWIVVPPADVDAKAHTLTATAAFTSDEGPGSVERRVTLTTVPEGTIPRSRMSIAGVSSEEAPAEGAANAIDGDPSTLWHGAWSITPAPTFPHWITIDLGAPHVLDGYRYLPRPAGQTNGNLKDYEIHVSDDNVEWGEPVATGAFAGGTGWKQVDFAETTGRYIRLTGLSSQNGLQWGGGAEFQPMGTLASPQPDVDVTTSTRVAGKNVKLTVTVDNRGSVPVDAKVVTAYGIHQFDDVQPGRTVFHPFNAGKAADFRDGIAVAQVSAEIDGETVSRSLVMGYTMPETTAPTVTVKSGDSFTIGDAETGYEKVSFKLYDAGKIDRVVINGVVKDLVNNTWSDVNHLNPGVFGAVAGRNTLVAYDAAGNATTVEFTLR